MVFCQNVALILCWWWNAGDYDHQTLSRFGGWILFIQITFDSLSFLLQFYYSKCLRPIRPGRTLDGIDDGTKNQNLLY